VKRGALKPSDARLRKGAMVLTIALHEPTRELIKGNTRVRLQEQPFQIMRLLLARPGALVTREQLRRRLWPDGTFVDFEHSLNAAVKRLRAALGDDAKAPRYIETLPRRGYRWINAVIPLDSRPDRGPQVAQSIEIVWT
jgi:DNA-binding winged helix-turn-helix (wHTH) protein